MPKKVTVTVPDGFRVIVEPDGFVDEDEEQAEELDNVTEDEDNDAEPAEPEPPARRRGASR